jgi:hypothetical protein
MHIYLYTRKDVNSDHQLQEYRNKFKNKIKEKK